MVVPDMLPVYCQLSTVFFNSKYNILKLVDSFNGTVLPNSTDAICEMIRSVVPIFVNGVAEKITSTVLVPRTKSVLISMCLVP